LRYTKLVKAPRIASAIMMAPGTPLALQPMPRTGEAMTPRGRWHVFRKIWRRNSWLRGIGVRSGLDRGADRELRCRLPAVLSQLGIRTLVDAPCGDMNWMRHLDYPFERFIGIDIPPALIDGLRAQRFPPTYHFQVGNIATDILPRADASSAATSSCICPSRRSSR
jgi:hypothetical protein